MLAHQFSGMDKTGVPVLSNEWYNLPSDKYPSFAVFKEDYNRSLIKEVCCWFQDMCIGSTISTRSQGLWGKNSAATTRTVVYFEKTKDIMAFRLAYPELFDLIFVDGKYTRNKPIKIDLDKIRSREKNKKEEL